MLLFAAVLTACSDSEDANSGNQSDPSGGGKLTFEVNKSYIKADGTDQATFRLLLRDNNGYTHDVTPEAEIFCAGNPEPLAGAVFTSTTEGDFSFHAIYKRRNSNTVKVSAVNGIKDLPADPDPASFAFAHRMLLVQHTGTECPNCPRMMNLLKALAEDEAYASKYHHVASHSYNSSDDAYSGAAVTLSREVNLDGYYPWLTFDLTTDYEHDIDAVKSYIDKHHQAEAEAGIAIAASLVGNRIYANIGLKVAKTNGYRLAVWLLEDNIQSNQWGATASWQHIHNNCLREMAGENKTTRIYGSTMGELESGQEYYHVSSFLVSDSWNGENCKVLVILTRNNEAGEIEVVNSALCAVGNSTPYAY